VIDTWPEIPTAHTHTHTHTLSLSRMCTHPPPLDIRVRRLSFGTYVDSTGTTTAHMQSPSAVRPPQSSAVPPTSRGPAPLRRGVFFSFFSFFLSFFSLPMQPRRVIGGEGGGGGQQRTRAGPSRSVKVGHLCNLCTRHECVRVSTCAPPGWTGRFRVRPLARHRPETDRVGQKTPHYHMYIHRRPPLQHSPVWSQTSVPKQPCVYGMYVCMCVCMYVCMCVCMYVCMCVCVHVCTQIDVHIL